MKGATLCIVIERDFNARFEEWEAIKSQKKSKENVVKTKTTNCKGNNRKRKELKIKK